MQLPSTKDTLHVFEVISKLANVYRHNTMTFDTQRKENVAEHSYNLATLGCALAAELNKQGVNQLNVGRIAEFALVHDLLEIFMEDGDISVYAPAKLIASKKTEEAAAVEHIKTETRALPWVEETIKEYESQSTPESRFVYALDKIIVHMVIAISNQHHAKPTFARYLQTEAVARDKVTKAFPVLLPYFEDLCQIFRDRPHLFRDEKD